MNSVFRFCKSTAFIEWVSAENTTFRWSKFQSFPKVDTLKKKGNYSFSALSSDDIPVKIKERKTTRSFRSQEILISAPLNEYKSRSRAIFHCLFCSSLKLKEAKTSKENSLCLTFSLAFAFTPNLSMKTLFVQKDRKANYIIM